MIFTMLAMLLVLAGVPQVAAGRTMEAQSATATLPAGAVLYLRLESAVGTQASHLRQVVTARVVREVRVRPDGTDVAIPLGAVVRGTIDKLIPNSNSTDRARLRLRFTQLELPGRSPVPLQARVMEVENAREC